MRLALFQPDIPQNTGNIIRLAACFNIEVNIIEPAGFTFNNKKLQRSAMDYYNFVKIKKHVDWHQFYDWSVKNNLRLVYPPNEICGDNAAMIANVCLENNKLGINSDIDFKPNPRLSIEI